MKRSFCCLLCCACLLLCIGCGKNSADSETGTAFFYPQAQLSYQPGSAAIGSELRSLENHGTWAQVLNIYFAGPQSEHLSSPFPAGLETRKTTIENGTLYITVSAHLAQLTGLELTMACSCLTLTCLELTGADTVVISAEDSLLDGQKTITMDKNTLLLLDSVLEGD